MQTYPSGAPEHPPNRDLGAPILVLTLTLLGGVLAATVGGPPLPSTAPRLPTMAELELLLRSPSGAQLGGALSVLSWLAWLTWGWLLATVVLRVVVLLGERVAAGAAWLRSLRAFSDLVTLPSVRKVVDASLAGTLFLRVAGGSLAGGVLLPDVTHAQVQVVGTGSPVAPVGESGEAAGTPELREGDLLYTVGPGDSLGHLAERFYGDWTAYERIYVANADQPQPDGRTLQDARKIYPGWRLVIPGPIRGIETADGARWYTVQDGDYLEDIAAKLLGDPARAGELFELNRGARLPDGRALADPDLIWPGLRLRLPGVPVTVAAPPTAPTTVAPPVLPVEPVVPIPATAAAPDPPAPTPVTTVEPAEAALPLVPAEDSPAVVEPSAPAERVLAAEAAGAAAVAAAGTAALLLARRARANGRRRLHDDPEPADLPYDFGGPPRVLAGGFVASDAARLARQRARGVELDKVPLTADRLRAAAAELELPPVELLTALEGERGILFVASVAGEQGRWLDDTVRDALEGRLACVVDIERNPDGDLAIELDHLRAPDMVYIGQTGSGDLWLAVAVDGAGQRVHLNLAGAGHLLIAGREAGTLLSTLALGAAAARPPDALELAIVRVGDSLPAEIEELPHTRRDGRGPRDAHALLGELVDELVVARTHTADMHCRVLVVVEELAAVADIPELQSLLAGRTTHRVHVLAATDGTSASLAASDVAGFQARVALRLEDAETSAVLLGRPGAEELSEGGDLYVRLIGREPLRARGLRTEPAEWQECLAAMAWTGRAVPVEDEAPIASTVDPGRAAAEGAERTVATSVDEPPEPESADEGEVLATAAEPLPPTAGALAAEGRQESVEPTHTARVEIHCFGPFSVERDGEAIADWKRPGVREIIACIAVHHGRGISLDHLVEAICPEKDLETAKGYLYPRISLARKVLGHEPDRPLLQFLAERYKLDGSQVWVDVAAFDEALRRTQRAPEADQEALLVEAAELYRGELCADLTAEWLTELQDEYRAKALSALNRAASCAVRRSDFRAAAERYRRALALDPINEEIAVNLARVFHQVGDRAGLLRLRSELTTALRRELPDEDAERQPETEEVFDTALAELEARRTIAKAA